MNSGCRSPAAIVAATVMILACMESAEPPSPIEADCDAGAVRDVVGAFGERLREIPLLAPDSVLVPLLRDVYGGLATPATLDRWIADPGAAPGREVSSPWPERIEIRSVAALSDTSCIVEGDVVYVTSAEVAEGGEALREPVRIEVVLDGVPRISAYQAARPNDRPEDPTGPAGDTTEAGSGDPERAAAAAAADVIHRYYRAIAAGEYARAYELWADDGAASGQTLDAFAAGFAATESVQVDVGEPGRVEGAAGSRYIRIPVVIRATTEDGEAQRFEGSYTLRRSVVEGASEDQRRWHLYSAEITRIR